MSDLDNGAVVKIIAQHTKEYNELLSQHNTLLEVHTKTVNDYFKLKEEMKKYLEELEGVFLLGLQRQ